MNKSKHPLYNVWHNMCDRCSNPKAMGYERYGGRGIRVCPRWQTFENFAADMSPRPKGMTLERKDNGADYELSNCEWITRAAQARNRRDNIMLTHDGQTMCLKDWSVRLKINRETLRHRIKIGWSVVKALTTETFYE